MLNCFSQLITHRITIKLGAATWNKGLVLEKVYRLASIKELSDSKYPGLYFLFNFLLWKISSIQRSWKNSSQKNYIPLVQIGCSYFAVSGWLINYLYIYFNLWLENNFRLTEKLEEKDKEFSYIPFAYTHQLLKFSSFTFMFSLYM